MANENKERPRPVTRREFDEIKENIAMIARSMASLVVVYEQLAEREIGLPIIYPPEEPVDEATL